MNLYLVSQSENNDYDTYSDFVCAAESEEAARMTMPSEYEEFGKGYGAWASKPEKVKVEFIGTAKEGTEASVICASFHAG